jgi:hypothetical protein
LRTDPAILSPLSRLEEGLGRHTCTFLVAYLLIVMIVGWWVPSNDFDSMATYLPAVRIADTDGLNVHNSTQAQRFAPLFFTRLEERLLATGYLSSLINFTLFLACIYAVARCYPKNAASLTVLLLFAVQPIVVALTSLKNDLTVGTVALLTTLAIFRLPPSIWYPSACFAGLALLAGTKWHGFIIGFPLVLAVLYKLSTSHRPTRGSILVLVGCLPVLAIVSSAEQYWRNYQETRSLFPRMGAVQYLSHAPRDVVVNVYRFVSCTIIDTFSLPLYFANIATDGWAWRWVNSITAGGQDLNFVIGPNSTHSAFGLPLLMVLIASLWAIVARNVSAEVRTLAFASVFYCVVVTSMSRYIGFAPRYYIASYMLGAIPLAVLISSMRPRVYSVWMAVLGAYMLVESMQALLLDPERALIGYPVSVRTGTASVDYHQPSIWERISNREELYFQSWPGYLPPYWYFAGNVLKSDSVLFMNCGQNQDAPFIYPFLRVREQANTAFYRCDDLGSQDAFMRDHQFRFVVAYKHRIADARYDPVLVQEGFFDIAIYRMRGGVSTPEQH